MTLSERANPNPDTFARHTPTISLPSFRRDFISHCARAVDWAFFHTPWTLLSSLLVTLVAMTRSVILIQAMARAHHQAPDRLVRVVV
jgi:hypothetical protein